LTAWKNEENEVNNESPSKETILAEMHDIKEREYKSANLIADRIKYYHNVEILVHRIPADEGRGFYFDIFPKWEIDEDRFSSMKRTIFKVKNELTLPVGEWELPIVLRIYSEDGEYIERESTLTFMRSY